MRDVNVGIVGLGNIGTGTLRILSETADQIALVDGEFHADCSYSRAANPGTDSQFPANCAGNLVSVPGLRRIAAHLPKTVKHLTG